MCADISKPRQQEIWVTLKSVTSFEFFNIYTYKEITENNLWLNQCGICNVIRFKLISFYDI